MSKVALIVLSSLLLVGFICAVALGFVSNWGRSEDRQVDSSVKAVQAICQPTDYKEACFKSMSNVSTDDPKELVRAAFRTAKEELVMVTQNSPVIKELEKNPETADAIKDCRELFDDAIDDLQRSFEGLGEFEWNKVDRMLANVKVWLSASITYQETCLDGFDNNTKDAQARVREVLKMSLEMTSNGLAIAMDMSSLLSTIDTTSFNRRRLLSYLGQRGEGHTYNDPLPYFFDRHSREDHRRHSELGTGVDTHIGAPASEWLRDYPFRNRRLLDSGSTHDGTLMEDDEPDTRRRRLLGLDHDSWLEPDRRWLLKVTHLTTNLHKVANVTVAKDGSGKYKTIGEALKEVPEKGKGSFIIYIKEGVYNEYLTVEKWMTYVVFVGDGPTKTRIANDKNFVDGTKTYKTATLAVTGDYFMAKDIGIENTAGAIKHQAVALRVQADQSIFYNCHMDGFQDTLYAHTYRQFYRNCQVTGTIDFVFGDAAAFFQNCTFVVRKPLSNQQCIVTAQGRMERHQPTGIIIHKSRFKPDPGYYPLRETSKSYLGRPWKAYSRTIIMESFIDDFIQPEGWLPWDGDFGRDTCYYSEFHNEGPGAGLTHRVKWRGVKTMSYERAEKFMPVELFDTDVWIQETNVPYDPFLSTAFAPDMAPAGAPEDAATWDDVHEGHKGDKSKYERKSKGKSNDQDDEEENEEEKSAARKKKDYTSEEEQRQDERNEEKHENLSISSAPSPSPVDSSFGTEFAPSTVGRSLNTRENIKHAGLVDASDLQRMLMADEGDDVYNSTMVNEQTTYVEPLTAHQLERMLMADDDKQALLDLFTTYSRPSIAVSPNLPPSNAPSNVDGPSSGPSSVNGPVLAPGPAPSLGLGHSPSKSYGEEEVLDWLPPSVGSMFDTEVPASAPKLEAADDVATSLASEVHAHVIMILSGFVIYVCKLMLD